MLESLFNKVAGLRVPTHVFFCEICEIFKNTFFTKYFRWLLLVVLSKDTLNTFEILRKNLEKIKWNQPRAETPNCLHSSIQQHPSAKHTSMRQQGSNRRHIY